VFYIIYDWAYIQTASVLPFSLQQQQQQPVSEHGDCVRIIIIIIITAIAFLYK